FYNKAILVYPQESSPLRLSMLYSDLGQVYSALEQWSDAQKTYKIAIELCQNYGYKKGAGELNVLLGEAYYRKGKREQAIFAILQACKLFAQIDDNPSLVNVLQYYAFIKYEIPQYELAREAMHRAIVLLIHQEDWEGVSEGLYFMMKILQSLGLLEEAQEYLKLSIQYCVDQENSLAIRLLSLGKLMIQKEEYHQGKKNLLKAAEIFELLGDDLRLGECYESLATIADYLGNEVEKEYYQKEFKRTIAGYHAHSLNAIIRLAEYYEGRRQYFDALRCYWQGIEIARDLGFEIDDLERSVQRVSRKVRQKRNRIHF
ncbi:MAG: tetratricopeptide repeat protein, partial [Desulfitobacterium sp.]|nr:tetratricopeptide repeat protein [Desulfitobacterium sp.]